MFKSLPLLSKSLIVAFIFSAMVELFLRLTWGHLIVLSGDRVIEGFEIWRLFTYPFFVNFWSAVTTSLIIWFFASELETIVHTPKLSLMLGLCVVVGAIAFIGLDKSGVLYGPSIIGVFLLTGFAYMWPERQISIMGLFWVKSWIIALVYFIVAIIPSNGTQLDLSLGTLFGPIFGGVAALVLFHLNFRQHDLFSGITNRVKVTTRPKEDANDPRSIEKRIDQILDKIASNGMNSLSEDEKDFLMRHSK